MGAGAYAVLYAIRILKNQLQSLSSCSEHTAPCTFFIGLRSRLPACIPGVGFEQPPTATSRSVLPDF